MPDLFSVKEQSSKFTETVKQRGRTIKPWQSVIFDKLFLKKRMIMVIPRRVISAWTLFQSYIPPRPSNSLIGSAESHTYVTLLCLLIIRISEQIIHFAWLFPWTAWEMEFREIEILKLYLGLTVTHGHKDYVWYDMIKTTHITFWWEIFKIITSTIRKIIASSYM